MPNTEDIFSVIPLKFETPFTNGTICFYLVLSPCWHEIRAIGRNGSKVAYYSIHKVGKKNGDGFKSESGKLIMLSLNILKNNR